MTRVHVLLAAAAVCLVTAGPGGAAAADLNIRAFFGKFQGGGVAESADSLYFGMSARDADVEIRPAASGFRVTWTSVIRGGNDPSNPKIRRKTNSRTFGPTARPGIWVAADSSDPMGGAELCWARLHGSTLTVYLMVVPDNGTYEIQKYDRTISSMGMSLVFTRVRDGEQVRTVKARLVKVAN